MEGVIRAQVTGFPLSLLWEVLSSPRSQVNAPLGETVIGLGAAERSDLLLPNVCVLSARTFRANLY